MRSIAGVIASLFLSLSFVAPAQAREGPFTWAHHAVSTVDAQAQQLFDEGLTCLYAYNRECAQDRFTAAGARDPKLAMAWWGLAMALGPNINYPSDTAMIVKAVDALVTARALSANATPVERSLIDAASARYAVAAGVPGEVRATPYAQAMQRLASAYPDDPDVQAFYIESLLDIPTLQETLTVVDPQAARRDAERFAQRWPTHLGLQHFLIHALEPDAIDRAVASANMLYATPLVPEASHLNHMASHVYYYLGNWPKFSAASKLAIDMDEQQAATRKINPAKLDYWRHNLDFWYGGAVMSDDEPSARAAAEIAARDFPSMRWVCAQRFGHTDEALRLIDATHFADDLAKTKNLRLLSAYALASIDGGRASDAQRVVDLLPAGSPEQSVPMMVGSLLRGRMADAKGDAASARDFYERAARIQDAFIFEAAPPWYFAPRELLAAMELRLGNAAAAIAAAQADLRKHQHNTRSMRTLRDAYTAAGMKDDAARTDRALAALRSV